MAAAMAPGLAFARSRPRVPVPARAKRRGWHATGELRSRPRCTGAFERCNAAPSPSARAADGVRADREGDRYRIDAHATLVFDLEAGFDDRGRSVASGEQAAGHARGHVSARSAAASPTDRATSESRSWARGATARSAWPRWPGSGRIRGRFALRRDRGDGKRRAGSLRDLERVRERSLTVAGGLAHDDHAPRLPTIRFHRGCSDELWSEESESTPYVCHRSIWTRALTHGCRSGQASPV